MNTFEPIEPLERPDALEIFSVPVKAGKRIYYFDVKSTRNNDLYLTLTESRKRMLKDGTTVIDKHKLHLYKEDFEKFTEGLLQAIDYIKANQTQDFDAEFHQEIPTEEEFFKGL